MKNTALLARKVREGLLEIHYAALYEIEHKSKVGAATTDEDAYADPVLETQTAVNSPVLQYMERIQLHRQKLELIQREISMNYLELETET